MLLLPSENFDLRFFSLGDEVSAYIVWPSEFE